MPSPIKAEFFKALIWLSIGAGLLACPLWGVLFLAFISCGVDFLGPCGFYEINALFAFLFFGSIAFFLGLPTFLYSLLLLGSSFRKILQSFGGDELR